MIAILMRIDLIDAGTMSTTGIRPQTEVEDMTRIDRGIVTIDPTVGEMRTATSDIHVIARAIAIVIVRARGPARARPLVRHVHSVKKKIGKPMASMRLCCLIKTKCWAQAHD